MAEKQKFEPADVAVASMFSVQALSMELAKAGVLTMDQVNGAFALAASMCQGAGRENAAEFIFNVTPSARGIDPVEYAKSTGMEIKMPD